MTELKDSILNFVESVIIGAELSLGPAGLQEYLTPFQEMSNLDARD